MNRILKISLIFVLMFEIGATTGVAEDKNPSSLSVRFQQDTLVIQAERVPLGEILNEIQLACRVKIEGLENRKEEPITFSSDSGTLYEALRRLFSLLDEGNYAFEFHDQELVRVLVLPETKGEIRLSIPVRKAAEKDTKKETESEKKETRREFITVPKILQIDAGSQAEAVGLLKDDLIVEYDGVKIRASSQLVGEVKKKSNMEEVEIVVIRDQKSMGFALEGGTIGVGVEDVKIPKEEFDSYQ